MSTLELIILLLSISTIISLLALIVSIGAIKRTKSQQTINLKKLNDSVSSISIKVGDLSNKVQKLTIERKEKDDEFNKRFEKIDDFLLTSLRDKNGILEVSKGKHKKIGSNIPFEVNAPETTVGEKVLEPKPVQAPELKKETVHSVPKTLAQGMKRTRDSFFSGLVSLWRGKQSINAEFYSKLEELLIASDFGLAVSNLLIKKLKDLAIQNPDLSEYDLINALAGIMTNILDDSYSEDKLLSAIRDGRPSIILMVGVNGVGKTTTVGKFAARFKDANSNVLIVAGDTFRAAATEQLQIWGLRSNVEIIYDEQSKKPGAVVYDAIKKMREKQFDIMLIDTAGRLNNKNNLMAELEALGNLIKREAPDALLEVVMVVDATTGQNALQQARDFNKAIDLNSLVVTKCDGTAKGGIILAIKTELDLPIRFIGVGENLEDLKPFVAQEFIDSILNYNHNLAEDENNQQNPQEHITSRRVNRNRN